MRTHLFSLLLLCAIALSGCSGSSNGETRVPSQPSGALYASGGDVWAQTMLQGEGVERVWPWKRGYLVRTQEGLSRWADGQVTPLDVDALQGARVEALWTPQADKPLLTTSQGLFVVDGLTVRTSPLSNHFKSAAPTHIVQVAQDIWLANSQGVFVWRGDALKRVDLDGVSLAGASLSAGPDVEGRASVWAATASGVMALSLDGDAIRATTEDPSDFAALTATEQGLWALVDGRVTHRDATGRWSALSGPQVWTHILGSPRAPGLWLKDADEKVWHLANQALVEVAQPDLWSDGGFVDSRGRLVRALGGDVARFDRRLGVEITPHQGDPLREPTQLGLVLSFPERVREATARVGDVSFDVDIEQGQVTIDPQAIGTPGRHKLSVDVSYEDLDAKARDTSTFEVGALEVSWVGQIEPLAQKYQCTNGTCHGNSSSHNLTTPLLWQAEIDAILEQTTKGLMPLGSETLTSAEVGLIRAWQEQGFKETTQ